MALPDEGPCEPWTDWAGVIACCDNPDVTSIDDPVQQQLHIDSASEVLFALSWHQYPGHCTAVRSFCLRCGPGCRRHCQCRREILDLTGKYAAASVERVTLAGVDLTPDVDYRLDEWGQLLRLGGDTWPRGANVGDDPRAFEVAWTFGRAIPAGGTRSANRLTCEMAKACIPNGKCNLPSRITGVNREGVTYTIIDPLAIIREGATGLTDVDQWLYTVTTGAEDRGGGIFDPGGVDPMIATNTGT